MEEQYKKVLDLINQDKYPDALNLLADIYKEDPNNPEVIKLSIFLFSRIMQGNADFEPSNSKEYMMRGVARFYMKDEHSAIKDLSKAIELDQNNDYAYKCRGFFYGRLGMLSQAKDDLHKAIMTKPTGEYFDDLSEIYYAEGEHALAIDFHKKAVEHSPDSARLWYNFGVSHLELGNIKESYDLFSKALEIWPQYPDALENKKFIEENYGHLLK